MRISDWSSDVCSSDLGSPSPACGRRWRKAPDEGGERRELPCLLPLAFHSKIKSTLRCARVPSSALRAPSPVNGRRAFHARPRGMFIRSAVRCPAADVRKPSMKYSRAALLPSPWAAGLFALLLTLPVFARAQDVPRPTPGTPPTVLVMGDSLSAGYGLSTEQGWVALLEDKIEAGKPGWRVVMPASAARPRPGARRGSCARRCGGNRRGW